MRVTKPQSKAETDGFYSAPPEQAPSLKPSELLAANVLEYLARDKKTDVEQILGRSPVACAFRYIQPTWRNYIHYASLAAQNGDEEMVKFVKCYRALAKKERKETTPEELCDLAQIEPASLVGAVSSEVWRQQAAESSMVAAFAHPDVLKATAAYAQFGPDNTKDRELFFRVTGSLPDKKGASIVINNSPQANTSIVGPGGAGGGYKSMDEDTIEMERLLDEGPSGAGSVFTIPVREKDKEPVIDV